MTAGMTPGASVSVPANLLLMGEYAVLEEGGLGLAVAPDVRVTGTIRPSDGGGIAVVGHLPGRTVRWDTGSGRETGGGLLALAALHLSDSFPAAGVEARIELESAAFFASSGEKRGFGSSAAIVVALTALWLRATGNLPDDESDAQDLIFHTAVLAHRAAQHGRGSGYDVASSTFGGVILFTGGKQPSARRITLPWLPAMQVVQGSAPVRTVSAVETYERWKITSPRAARVYQDGSNRLVSAFAKAPDWTNGAAILTEYRDLAVELGATLGVPATMDRPSWLRGSQAVVKSVGAGNELGVVLAAGSSHESQSGTDGQITLSEEGITWS
jgi:phosphomevalonate kinase